MSLEESGWTIKAVVWSRRFRLLFSLWQRFFQSSLRSYDRQGVVKLGSGVDASIGIAKRPV
jgi:hypothetical protein